ncbi:hypothetical protein ACT7DA_09250 [Bacillus pacificus]
MDLNGVQVKDPVINEQALEWGFTNEGTADGEFRLLKNIMGLWLIQECRGTWAKRRQAFYLRRRTTLIRNTKPFAHFIDPDDPSSSIRKIC